MRRLRDALGQGKLIERVPVDAVPVCAPHLHAILGACPAAHSVPALQNCDLHGVQHAEWLQRRGLQVSLKGGRSIAAHERQALVLNMCHGRCTSSPALDHHTPASGFVLHLCQNILLQRR